MDTTVNSAAFASLPTRCCQRLSSLASCAVTTVFVLSGIDLRAIAWGGLWLRDLTALITTQNHA
jgi:hypothetical protein